MILFFDTETTGLVNWKQPDTWEGQPRLVQLGAILTEDSGRVVRTLGCIVRPDEFLIPIEASNVHGITTEYAIETGIAQFDAVTLFAQMLNKADKIVAHNYKFDKVVMNRELFQEEYTFIDDSKSFCTMLASTNICKLPHKGPKRWAGQGAYKWPKCSEAYECLFSEKLEGAHDALTDVRACMRIYFKLQEMMKRDNNIVLPEGTPVVT